MGKVAEPLNLGENFSLITEHWIFIITISLYEVLHFSLKLNSIFPENRVKRNIKTQYVKVPLKGNTKSLSNYNVPDVGHSMSPRLTLISLGL